MKQTFERGADQTLERCRAIYSLRGGEYSDTWALPNLVTTWTEHTLREVGDDRSVDALRLIQLAALIDVKDSRMLGPWKDDSCVDGIAYRALYAALRASYTRSL